MSKQKKVILVAAIVAAVLIMAMGSYAVYRYFAPSSDKKDLNSIFELQQDEVALIVNDVVLEERGLLLDGKAYIPEEIASGYMDERIFVDTTENIFSYATNDGLIQAEADSLTYTVGKESKDAETPLLRTHGDNCYVALSFLEEHSSCTIEKYEEPARLMIMTDRTKSYTFGNVSEDTRVRTGPGKKYSYLTEIPQGTRVIVETTVPQENEYMSVTTLDGVNGYIPVERIAQTTEENWKFEKEPESFEQNAMKGTVCLAWHQTTNEESSKNLPGSVSNAASLNVISPTWYILDDNKGGFFSLANADYVQKAHKEGLKVWGLVKDFDDTSAGRTAKLNREKIFGTTSSRTKLVNSLVGSAIRYDLDGINVDFEKIDAKSAAAYLEFLRELTIKCHANDLVVSVDNYTPANYNSFYNIEEQGRIVDYVVLMAYDEHYAGDDEAGSVSSLGFVTNGVKNTLAVVPKERVVVGLPFFTRLWKEVKGKKPTSTAYGMSAAESVLRANDTASKWDEETGQYYAKYKADGATYEIWLEEETSLGKKLEVLKENDVAGVAFWKIGLERAVTWKSIADALK